MGIIKKGTHRNLVIIGILLILFSLAALYFVYAPGGHRSELFLLDKGVYSSSEMQP